MIKMRVLSLYRRLVMPWLFFLTFLFGAKAQKPELGLPVGHRDNIIHINFSRDGRYLLTAGMGTMKIWDFHTGKLLASQESGGSYYAKLSPDAKRVYYSTGGFTEEAQHYYWDIDNKKVVPISNSVNVDVRSTVQEKFLKSLPPGDSIASKCVFSPDGNKAVVLYDEGHFQYWDVQNNKKISEGTAPESFGLDLQPFYMAEFYPSVGFGPEGPLAIFRDGPNTIRVWDLLKGAVRKSITDKSMQYRMAVISPDGKSIVATDRKIQHWDLESGRLVRTYQDLAVGFGNIPPKPVAGGLFVGMESGMRYWNFQTGGISESWPWASQVGKDNRPFHFQKGSPAQLQFWQNGKLQQQNFPVLSRTVTAPDKFTVSPDMKRAVFQRAIYDERPYKDSLWVWDLDQDRQEFILAKQFVFISADLRQGITQSYDAGLNDAELWDLTTGQKRHALNNYFGGALAESPDGKHLLQGVVIPFNGEAEFEYFDLESGQLLSKYSIKEASGFGIGMEGYPPNMALSHDNRYFLFESGGGEVPIKLCDIRTGQVVKKFTGQSHFISAAFSDDGRFVYTTHTDYSLRIWDVASGKEMAALYALGDQDWVVVAPNGMFDASPGAMNVMYYKVGREIVELDQLKERYYEPGLLSKLLGQNQDPLRSTEAFNTLALYPDMTAKVSDDKLKLQVNFTPRAGGIGKLSVFVNGKEVVEDANPGRATNLNIDLTAFAQYYLPGESNRLALRVYNQAGWLKSPALELGYQPPAVARGNTAGAPAPAPTSLSGKTKPALYAVVVGTSDYAGDKLDLKFADHDASLFSQALRAAASKVFDQQVFVTLLNTDAADQNRQDVSNKANIKKAFTDIAAKAKAQDVLVIYFSGHGVNYGTAEQGQFYYLTKDIASENLTDPEIRNNYTVSSTELTGWIKAIPALKQVMILDACNSGKIVEDLAGRKDLSSSQVRALDRMKDRTGMFILTGSAADKVSFEASQYGQGLLTYSLLQGMSGLALTDDKRVDVMTLFQFSRDKVPELAKGIGGIQTPILAFPVSGASFDIGIVDAQVKIPLAQVKPVFIRNMFQDEDSFDDVLGLTPALAAYFRQITLQGAQANLIYVDVAEYENAYSMKGRYKQNGDVIEVRGRLFKGKTAKGEFQVTGKKSDMPGLVEAIVEKVSGMIE